VKGKRFKEEQIIRIPNTGPDTSNYEIGSLLLTVSTFDSSPCELCGIEAETIDLAIENDWLPYFYEGEV
jgi:hypothetical protein